MDLYAAYFLDEDPWTWSGFGHNAQVAMVVCVGASWVEFILSLEPNNVCTIYGLCWGYCFGG